MASGKRTAKKVSASEAETIITDYMAKNNRPFSAKQVFENLHGSVGMTQVTKILNDLVSSDVLCCKDQKSKLYWFNQSNIEEEESNTTTTSAAPVDIESLNAQITTLSEQVRHLEHENASLRAQPPDKEVPGLIEKLQAENADMEARLDVIKSSGANPEAKTKAEVRYAKMEAAYKKRKKLCNEAISLIVEGTGKAKKKLIDDMGIDTDESAGFSYEPQGIVRDTKRARKL